MYMVAIERFAYCVSTNAKCIHVCDIIATPFTMFSFGNRVFPKFFYIVVSAKKSCVISLKGGITVIRWNIVSIIKVRL
jgi:hypothetical protein